MFVTRISQKKYYSQSVLLILGTKKAKMSPALGMERTWK